MIESLIAITLIIIAYRHASNSQARTGQQALDATWAWVIGFVAFLAIAVFVVPFVWGYVRVYMPVQYAPIISDVSGGVASLQGPSQLPAPRLPGAPQTQPQPTITLADPPTLLPETGGGVLQPQQGEVLTIVTNEQYTVARGDNLRKIADRFGVAIEDIVAANSLSNPDRITEGQVLLIPQAVQVTATPAPTPVPTVTPIPVAPESVAPAEAPSSTLPLDETLAQVGSHRLNGEMDAGEELLKEVLEEYPGNETATKVLGEIAMYREFQERWQNLDEVAHADGVTRMETGLLYDDSRGDYVDALLGGFEFEIIAYRNDLFKTAKAELMTVRCTTRGWLYGTEFTLQAIHVTKRGANKVGETFAVPDPGT